MLLLHPLLLLLLESFVHILSFSFRVFPQFCLDHVIFLALSRVLLLAFLPGLSNMHRLHSVILEFQFLGSCFLGLSSSLVAADPLLTVSFYAILLYFHIHQQRRGSACWMVSILFPSACGYSALLDAGWEVRWLAEAAEVAFGRVGCSHLCSFVLCLGTSEIGREDHVCWVHWSEETMVCHLAPSCDNLMISDGYRKGLVILVHDSWSWYFWIRLKLTDCQKNPFVLCSFYFLYSSLETSPFHRWRHPPQREARWRQEPLTIPSSHRRIRQQKRLWFAYRFPPSLHLSPTYGSQGWAPHSSYLCRFEHLPASLLIESAAQDFIDWFLCFLLKRFRLNSYNSFWVHHIFLFDLMNSLMNIVCQLPVLSCVLTNLHLISSIWNLPLALALLDAQFGQ